MAWLTVIGPAAAQVDYRLEESAGCGPAHGHDHDHGSGDQVGYRMDETNRLTWFGGGLAEVGITAGTALAGEADKARARALMDGVHPQTGEQLVVPKRAAHPAGKLPAVVLLEHLGKVAADRGAEPGDLVASRWGRARVAQMRRMVARDGDAHRVSIKDLERLAAAAGVDLADAYQADELQVARAHRGHTVRIGDRGFDLTIDIPKSPSVVWALADPATAALLQEEFRQAVVETLTDLEAWCSYAMRGKNGDGRTATRIDTSGLLGWVMWHDVARPVDGQAPDPHLHAHAVIAHMVRGADGQWSTPGNGGREFHRHVQAAGALAQARFRAKTTALGFVWEKGEGRTWELAGVPPQARALYSKRAAQTAGTLAKLAAARGVDADQAPRLMAKEAAARSRQAKTAPAGEPAGEAGWRVSWRVQAEHAGLDPAGIVAAARGDDGPGGLPGGPTTGGGPTPQPPAPSVQEIAQEVFHPEHGLTAHSKVATRPRVLAAVLDTLAAGVTDVHQAQALVDAVVSLPGGPAGPLPAGGGRERGPAYQTHPDRYTTADIIAAEIAALDLARAGYRAPGEGGLAVVDEPVVELAIETFEAARGFALSAEQRAVVTRLATGGHAVDAVIGVAGSGKTTLMAAARTAYEAAGMVVAGATTAAVAAQALQIEAGIASATIASRLAALDDGDRPGLAGVDVLVIDEAAMVDDRQLARLLQAANTTGTKVVLIGDPAQLKAIGVGGAFAAIHRQVGGLALTENRRQRSDLERQALQAWRDGDRDGALREFGRRGAVHAGNDRDDTLAVMLADWAAARTRHTGDPHTELAQLLVLAGTNTDVDDLNTAARTIRRKAGEITGPDRIYGQGGGRTLALAVGDHVRVRRNDYRTRRKGAPAGAVDVLNGYRGMVTGFAGRNGRDPIVQWMRPGPDGPTTVTATITAQRVAAGDLSHGTAMTVAAAQGQTADTALVYGMGLDAHALYPALSRHRDTVRLYLPRTLLESDADRIRHGQPATDADELTRAITAYARALAAGHDDALLTPQPDPIAHQHDTDQATREPAAEQPAAIPPWQQRPYGAHTDDQLHRLARSLPAQIDRLQRIDQAAEQQRRLAETGHGPSATDLHQRRTALQETVAIEARLQEAADQITAAQGASQAARLRIAQATAQLQRGRLALRRAGTSRQQVTADLADAERDLADADTAERDARTRHAQLRDQAAATYAPGKPRAWRPGAAAAELAAVQGGWDTAIADAIRRDVATAPTRATQTVLGRAYAAHLASAGMSGTYRDAADASAHHTQIGQELAWRAALPADRATIEQQQRTAHHAGQHRRHQQARRSPDRPHSPHRGGPGHGLGR